VRSEAKVGQIKFKHRSGKACRANQRERGKKAPPDDEKQRRCALISDAAMRRRLRCCDAARASLNKYYGAAPSYGAGKDWRLGTPSSNNLRQQRKQTRGHYGSQSGHSDGFQQQRSATVSEASDRPYRNGYGTVACLDHRLPSLILKF
jgi:hypothetical protein